MRDHGNEVDVKAGENDVHSIEIVGKTLKCFFFHCCLVHSEDIFINFVNCRKLPA